MDIGLYDSYEIFGIRQKLTIISMGHSAFVNVLPLNAVR